MGGSFKKSAKSEPAEVAPAEFRLSGTTVQRKSRGEGGVASRYKPLRKHPELFDVETGWREEWFDPDFLAALRQNTAAGWASIVTEHLPGQVFSCCIFTQAFCDMLIEEIDNFGESGLPARRPNSMNNYGIILNEIGWRPMVDILQDNVLAKVAALQWPDIAPFDDHHTFIVRYKEGEDLGLDMHTDDSDVTFNICLGKEFTAAGLSFCGVMGQPDHRHHKYTFTHQRGRCCWHLGRLRHGADDISAGERLNLIIWNHSSAYRNTVEYMSPAQHKESGPPSQQCLSYTHDRDYGIFKEYNERSGEFQGRGWCPRRGYEYKGFKAEEEPPGGVRGGGG